MVKTRKPGKYWKISKKRKIRKISKSSGLITNSKEMKVKKNENPKNVIIREINKYPDFPQKWNKEKSGISRNSEKFRKSPPKKN